MKVVYDVVTDQPVARFYYKGSHSHPVRRTVLVIENNNGMLVGYEMREGSVVREFKDAPVKTYLRHKIARQSDLGARKHRNPGPQVTSLQRSPLFDIFKNGV